MKHNICILCAAALFGLASCIPPSRPATEGTETTDTATVKESHIKTLNTQDFIREIYDFRSGAAWNYLGSKPCVIDFYTDWCRPCQAMAPLMEQLAENFEGRIDFYKVNADKEPALSHYFNIDAIPCFLFCTQQGEPIRVTGALSEEMLRTYLEKML
jgi:thioredoxin